MEGREDLVLEGGGDKCGGVMGGLNNPNFEVDMGQFWSQTKREGRGPVCGAQVLGGGWSNAGPFLGDHTLGLKCGLHEQPRETSPNPGM